MNSMETGEEDFKNFPSQLNFFLLKLRCYGLRIFSIEDCLKAERKLFSKFIKLIHSHQPRSATGNFGI